MLSYFNELKLSSHWYLIVHGVWIGEYTKGEFAIGNDQLSIS